MASVISVTPTSAVENTGFGGLLRFDVSLSEAGTDAITVDYRLLAGTADAQRDIADAKGTVTFAPGVLSQTIEVRATRDGIEEPDESVVMEFYDPVGATLSGNSETLKVTNFILDDDGTGNGGLADGIGHLFPFMKEKFGKDVKFAVLGPKKSLFKRFGAQIAEDAIASVEDRAAWARFGL